MTEIEPVAWRKKHSFDKHWRYEETGYIGDWDEVERLYTLEQLQPRVKMTQDQYDRLIWDKSNNDLSICLEYFLEHDGKDRFGKPVYNLIGSLTQEDIARAWVDQDCIDITTTKKPVVIDAFQWDDNNEQELCELLEAHERCRKEISDVRNNTPKLGIIGRVKYVQNNQEKYPELMKLGYHDMREVL